MKITPLDVPRCSVGESPLWDVVEQALYWIDLLGRKVFRYDPASGITREWSVPDVIGSMALTTDGAAIVALAGGVFRLTPATGACVPLASHPELTERTQLADGKVDRIGRFIVGSSDRRMKEPLGKLFALDGGSAALRPLDSGIILANGPCWALDNSTFYHADSLAKAIYAYDYDLPTGTVSSKRLFASTAEHGGIPDGATIDAEDHLWSAICEGSRLVRWSPDGRVERVIEMPVKYPSSVMFGGPDLSVLYVPSINPSFLGRPAAPLDGAIFAVEGTGIRGVPEPRFAHSVMTTSNAAGSISSTDLDR